MSIEYHGFQLFCYMRKTQTLLYDVLYTQDIRDCIIKLTQILKGGSKLHL